jgi:hypothetical protein
MKYSLRSLMKWGCVVTGIAVAIVGRVVGFNGSAIPGVVITGIGLGTAIIGFARFSRLWNRRRPEFAPYAFVCGCGFAALFLWASFYLQHTSSSRAIYLAIAEFWSLASLYMLLIILAPAPNPSKNP